MYFSMMCRVHYRTGNDTDLQSPHEALTWAEKYLHMADGMYFADEEVGVQILLIVLHDNWDS